MLGITSVVANSSKTAIILKDEFRSNHHETENEYLDAIHDRLVAGYFRNWTLSLSLSQLSSFWVPSH